MKQRQEKCDRPAVAVIVPFAGSRADALRLDESLAGLRLGAGDEVIVVDNSVDDPFAGLPLASSARVVPAKKTASSYYARNQGAERAPQGWLLFLDADCEPDPGILDAYLADPPSPRCGALVGAIRPVEDTSFVARYSSARGFLDQDDAMSQGDRAFGATANLMVRREAWQAIGGFADGVRSGGDQDFCWRLRDAGWSLVPAPAAAVRHHHRTTVTGLWRQWLRYGSGAVWLAKRHPERAEKPRHLRRLAVAILRCAVAALRGRREPAGFFALDALTTLAHFVGYRQGNASRQIAATKRSSRSRIVAWLPYPQRAPYLDRLRAELEGRDVEILPIRTFRLRDALRCLRRVQAIHLHWIEYLYRADSPGLLAWARAAYRAVRMIAWIGVMRLAGKRVVWTVHNRRPHESSHRRLDGVAFAVIRRLSSTVIVHSAHARQTLVDNGWDGDRIAVAPHGNFEGVYPRSTKSRSAIRKMLGLSPDSYLFLAFGQIRHYKNLSGLIEAMKRLPDEDAELLIAGAPVPAVLGEQLREQSAGDPRIKVVDDYVPSDDVTALHEAADAAVFAYDEIFTSGALLLALTFGLPVVAPSRGSAAEIVQPPGIECFSHDVVDAMTAVRRGDQAERRAAAIAAAARASWTPMAEALLSAYGR
jgi:beta-1,4-mannosyltransferase